MSEPFSAFTIASKSSPNSKAYSSANNEASYVAPHIASAASLEPLSG